MQTYTNYKHIIYNTTSYHLTSNMKMSYYLLSCHSKQIELNLPIQSPLLSSHLYWKVTCLLSCHRKCHINWTFFRRSPVL